MTIGIGHNGQLKSIIERIERLEEEKKAIAGDIKEVYAEAKGNGYDPKIIKAIIAIRKKDPAERAEFEAMIDTYMNAIYPAPSNHDHDPETGEVKEYAKPETPTSEAGHLTDEREDAEVSRPPKAGTHMPSNPLAPANFSSEPEPPPLGVDQGSGLAWDNPS